MTKKVPKKILRIERNFFVNLRKNILGRPRGAAPRRPPRRRFFFTLPPPPPPPPKTTRPPPPGGCFLGPGGAPPPPTEIDRRAAADTMTSAHSSTLEWDHYNLLQIKTLSPFAPLQCQSLAYSKMRDILQIFITAYYTESLHPQIHWNSVAGHHKFRILY